MWLLGSIITAWILSDFIAGFWHFIEDRYLGKQYNILGFKFDKPNVSHHDDPLALLDITYWGRNYLSIIVAVPLVLLGITFNWPLFLILSFVFASQANEVHCFAHNKGKNPDWVIILQQIGIFQSPKHHAEHHRSPFLIRYCVTSNFVNPVLDYFYFWDKLEKSFTYIGIKTNDQAN